MATWAAQLQSIQQLGTRLNRLSSVAEIGHGDRDRAAPADRLPQRPRLPARPATTSSRSRCRARSASTSTRRRTSSGSTLGEGITGWVAANRIAQNLGDAAGRPAGQHDPGDRGRPRRIDAPRADDLRRPGPRRPRALQAGPQPVQRRRPAPARDLRELRRPGDGQRRHDRAAARADARRSSSSSAASASCSRSPNRS